MNRLSSLLPLACAVALAIAGPMLGGYLSDLVVKVMILSIFALSLELLVGMTGLVSLGHAAFYGIGAYATVLASGKDGGNLLVVLLLSMGAAALYALVTGALSLRTKGVYFIMVTLAFAQMVFYFFQSLRRYGGENGFSLPQRNTFGGLIDIDNQTVFYYVCLTLLILVMFLALRIVNSQFGAVIRGGRDNERRSDGEHAESGHPGHAVVHPVQHNVEEDAVVWVAARGADPRALGHDGGCRRAVMVHAPVLVGREHDLCRVAKRAYLVLAH